jgi:hypothetical protein
MLTQPSQRSRRRLSGGVGTGVPCPHCQSSEAEGAHHATDHDLALAGAQLPKGLRRPATPFIGHQSLERRAFLRVEQVQVGRRPSRRQPPGIANAIDHGAVEVSGQGPFVGKPQLRPATQDPHDDVLDDVIWIEPAATGGQVLSRHATQKRIVAMQRLGRERRGPVHDVGMDGHIRRFSGCPPVATCGKRLQKAAWLSVRVAVTSYAMARPTSRVDLFHVYSNCCVLVSLDRRHRTRAAGRRRTSDSAALGVGVGHSANAAAAMIMRWTSEVPW